MGEIRNRWLFYGWIVVAGGFLTFAISAGLKHPIMVFLTAFLAEIGWSRADTSMAYFIAQCVSGASAPLIGILSTV